MSAYAFTMPAEFDGPGSSLLEGHLAIEFDHQRAEPDTNTYEGVAVRSVRVVERADMIREERGAQ